MDDLEIGYARALGLRDFRYDTVLQKLSSPVKQTVQQAADQLGNTLIDLEYQTFGQLMSRFQGQMARREKHSIS